MEKKPWKTVEGLPGVMNLEDLTKALHEGRLGDDPLLLAHVNRAIEEQKEKDDAKNAITIVEDNEHVRAGPSTIPGFGRGLFAVHDLAQYEEVSRTRPLVSVVYEGMEGDVCDWCFANAKAQETNRVELAEIEMPSIKRCSACRECGYCSHDCQQKAWNAYHKLECKAYRSPGYKNVTPDFINGNTRTVVRLLCMLKMGTMGEAKLEEIMELPHNSKETIKKTEIRPGFIMDPTALLRKRAQHSIAATGTGMEAEKVYDLLTIVMTHTVALSGEYPKPIAQGLVILATKFTHSCEPNTTAFVDGGEYCVRVTKALQAGEELTAGFTWGGDELETRRKKIVELYGFKCENRFRRSLKSLWWMLICEGPKCLRELLKMQTATPDQKREQEIIQKAQQDLKGLLAGFNHRGTSGAVVKLEAGAREIMKTAYPDGNWPMTLDPMKKLNASLVTAYIGVEKYADSFRLAIRAFIGGTSIERSDPRVVVENLTMFQLMIDTFVGVLREKRPGSEGCPLKWISLMLVNYFYLHVTARYIELVFGKHMILARVARAKIKQIRERALPDEYANVEKPDTNRIILTLQKKLLTWAGLPKARRLRLPTAPDSTLVDGKEAQ